MAYRFPGRPPGTDLSDSFSMASSIGDYIEEGDGAYRVSAADFLSFEEEQNRLQPQQQQQYPGEINCTFFFPPGMPQYRYSKNDIRHYFGPQQNQQHQKQHEDSAPANLFPGRPPGFIPPVYPSLQLLFESATVNASNALIPSQVRFLKLKGPPIVIGDDDSVAATDKTDGTMSDGGIGFEDEVSVVDPNGSDGIYTGIGLGNSFDWFHTSPEEEFIFESQDSREFALGVFCYHAFSPCVYI